MTVRLQGSTSGYVELDSPAVGGNNTLVLPSGNGNADQVIATNGSGALSWADRMTAAGPAFSATRTGSAQTVSASTWTKIQLNGEDFDTASAFDSTTNYRFQPAVAGYYLITGALETDGRTTVISSLYRNGLEYQRGSRTDAANVSINSNFSVVIFLNGSTDYVELYGFVSSGGFNVTFTRMTGSLIRPA
jgi:hypothetical protein